MPSSTWFVDILGLNKNHFYQYKNNLYMNNLKIKNFKEKRLLFVLLNRKIIIEFYENSFQPSYRTKDY